MARYCLLRRHHCRWIGIFALSNFSLTQRFGLIVLAATVIDLLCNLFVLPLLGGAERKRQKPGFQATYMRSGEPVMKA
jgi:hypothetical protein